MDILIRKPLEYEEEAFIHLCCELSKFNRCYHPDQEDDLEGVLEARAEKACRIFQGNDAKSVILMAVVNGTPVGYAMANIFNPDNTSDNGTELMALLEELFLKVEARGFGIGKMLVEEITKWAVENGAKRLRLQSYEWNDGIKRLCSQLDFRPYAVCYEKLLPQGEKFTIV